MTTTAVDDQFASDPEQPPSGQSPAPTDAIYDAIDILMSAADDLRECHTLASAPDDWTGEDEAKAEYDRILRCVAALRAQPAAATPDEIEGLRAHVALLKAALAQAERENDELRRAQPAAATVPADEREAFEAWVRVHRPYESLRRKFKTDPYVPGVQCYWEAWQARAALAANAAPQISDAIFLVCARLGLAGASDEEVLRYVRTAITAQGESRGDQ